VRYIGLDPSTKTGLVIIDEDAEIWEATEITYDLKDPERMSKIVDTVAEFLTPDSVVTIEGFAYGAKGTAVGLQYGIGWGLRMEMFRRGVKYIEVSPSAVKKFASGSGNTSKDNLTVPIYKRWGFESDSDNIRDAYVLAQIARALHEPVKLTGFQQDVIDAIRNPVAKAKKSKRKVG
jgi:crossover junction endodeoxyribonuclease RuvC